MKSAEQILKKHLIPLIQTASDNAEGTFDFFVQDHFGKATIAAMQEYKDQPAEPSPAVDWKAEAERVYPDNEQAKKLGGAVARAIKNINDEKREAWVKGALYASQQQPTPAPDALSFAQYLTGHDEATIRQMYEDWKGKA
jgi:hypothetical protein